MIDSDREVFRALGAAYILSSDSAFESLANDLVWRINSDELSKLFGEDEEFVGLLPVQLKGVLCSSLLSYR
jgi:hypothetical protein